MFAFAGVKTGWDKGKEQRCLLVLCLLCWKTGWDKRKKQKMPVCLCLCTFIEIRRGTKNLDLVLCTVVYIGLGKTSVTIWTISSVENWGNHWGKWTILRSFQDHMGDPAWWHWGCNLTAYSPRPFFANWLHSIWPTKLMLSISWWLFNYDQGVDEIQYDTMLYIDVQVPRCDNN